jgi:hypothetical protein
MKVNFGTAKHKETGCFHVTMCYGGETWLFGGKGFRTRQEANECAAAIVEVLRERRHEVHWEN